MLVTEGTETLNLACNRTRCCIYTRPCKRSSGEKLLQLSKLLPEACGSSKKPSMSFIRELLWWISAYAGQSSVNVEQKVYKKVTYGIQGNLQTLESSSQAQRWFLDSYKQSDALRGEVEMYAFGFIPFLRVILYALIVSVHLFPAHIPGSNFQDSPFAKVTRQISKALSRYLMLLVRKNERR